MRTKTLILAAAAALGVGIFTSQAAVTSANVVGYANIVIPANYAALENPMDVIVGGNTNLATDVLPNLPDLTYVYVWNGGSYDVYLVYQNQYYDQFGNNLVPTPHLNPGVGFFINSPSAFTNTFIGQVTVPTGTTNSMNLSSGYNFIGSALPEGGGVTTALGLNPPDLTYIYIWNGASFDVSLYFSGTWYDQFGNNPVPEPTVKVGDSYFLNLPSSYTWKQSLPSN